MDMSKTAKLSSNFNTSDLVNQTDNVTYNNCKIVIFDIETTGFSETDEIVQISAACGHQIFDVYIIPSVSIDLRASEVTGIQIRNEEMFVNNRRVTACSPQVAFKRFLLFLCQLEKPCILIAHNCFRFDAVRILKLASELRYLENFKMFVHGFCDSLDLFKLILPERKKNKQSFKQIDLAHDYLDKTDIKIAHNALNDVLMLQKLVKKLCKDKSMIFKLTKSTNFMIHNKEKMEECKKLLMNIEISPFMIGKILKAGIDKTTLLKACEKGLEGLSILLGENIDGKPRVTNNKRIIETIYYGLTK